MRVLSAVCRYFFPIRPALDDREREIADMENDRRSQADLIEKTSRRMNESVDELDELVRDMRRAQWRH